MVSNRMTDGVGKKIVDALKKQVDPEMFQPKFTVIEPSEDTQVEIEGEAVKPFEFVQEEEFEEEESPINIYQPEMTKPSFHFTQEPAIQLTSLNDGFASEIEDFELPANVAVLKQLITKLPSNVSKQTGAQIIKQTMEALGISMKSVLQEAQQVQENINASARECQNNIAEYKRQIGMLETQTQKLHRQYSMVNDIISLFIQAN